MKKLRDDVHEQNNLSLPGKSIVVTRAMSQASKLTDKLKSEGADVLLFPTIVVKPLDDLSILEEAIDNIKYYSWIYLTSQNAVSIFIEKFLEMKENLNDLESIRIAVVGPATEKELQKYRLKPDLVPEEFVAEGLIEASKTAGISGEKILLPCAVGARDTLAEGLSELGAEVVRVDTYQSVIPENISEEHIKAVKGADVVTFTSSSTARNYFELISDAESLFACIGPATAETVKKLGYKPHIVALEYTINGLVDAIVAYYSGTENND